MSGRKCAACGKSVLPMDPQITAEGGVWHRECAKCTHCACQITLGNMAQIKGTLYCKPHLVQLFKLRGKYDDLGEAPAAAAADGAASAPAEAPAAAPPAAPEVVAEAASEAAPADPAPAPPAAVADAAPAPVAAAPAAPPPLVRGPSVRDRIASLRLSGMGGAAAPAGAGGATPSPTGSAGGSPAAVPEGDEAAEEGGSSGGGGGSAPAVHAPAKSVRIGGSPSCGGCGSPVYPADPKVSADGATYHKACFKCLSCKGAVTLGSWSQIGGNVMCKPCFKKLFGARGKYDDVLAAVAELKAAAAGAGAAAGAVTAAEGSAS